MTAGTDDELLQLGEEIVVAANQMEKSGLVDGTAGNVSAVDASGSRVLITPTGVPYSALTAADLSAVSLDGTLLGGPYLPSSELPMHLQVYRARPDVRSVVHTHSRFATTFAVLNRPITAVHYVLAYAGSSVEVAPYQTYGSEGLGSSCVDSLGSRQATLLQNHGVLTVGASPAAALNVASSVEYCAELLWRAMCIGQPTILDEEEMALVQEKFASYGQPKDRR
jgi:L-fuculose-phosphate aldolase